MINTYNLVFSDFQKTAGLIQEFLSKLSCDESTAELRDSMNLVLFHLQRYYKKLRKRSLSSGTSPRFHGKTLSGGLILNGGVSPVSPACGIRDQFEWKWYNLESPRLSASLGTNEYSSLPLILQAAKSGDYELLKELIDKGKKLERNHAYIHTSYLGMIKIIHKVLFAIIAAGYLRT